MPTTLTSLARSPSNRIASVATCRRKTCGTSSLVLRVSFVQSIARTRTSRHSSTYRKLGKRIALTTIISPRCTVELNRSRDLIWLLGSTKLRIAKRNLLSWLGTMLSVPWLPVDKISSCKKLILKIADQTSTASTFPSIKPHVALYPLSLPPNHKIIKNRVFKNTHEITSKS